MARPTKEQSTDTQKMIQDTKTIVQKSLKQLELAQKKKALDKSQLIDLNKVTNMLNTLSKMEMDYEKLYGVDHLTEDELKEEVKAIIPKLFSDEEIEQLKTKRTISHETNTEPGLLSPPPQN